MGNVLKDTKVTIFSNLKDILKPYTINLEKALTRIKNGDSKSKVLALRQYLKDGNKKKYNSKKTELPAVIFGGVCNKKIKKVRKKDKSEYFTYRAKESVGIHSGVFVIDFDEVKDVPTLINRLKQDRYILACWVSPSGDDNDIKKGVKGLVRCPKDIENHEEYYCAFIEHRYPEIDPSQKDISTLCFESYDPNLYVNVNAEVWDKRITKKQQEAVRKERRGGNEQRIINRILPMFLQSVDGEKNNTLNKTAYILGGYVGSGAVNIESAREALQNAVRNKPNIEDEEHAFKTIEKGLDDGQKMPLEDIKKEEQLYKTTRKADGTLSCYASEEEMNQYITDFINGTLEMGLSTGFGKLDNHFLFKKRTLVWFGGLDNIGKSLILWYLSVLAAMFHGWKFVIYSGENSDGQVKKKIQELFLGRKAKLWTKKQRELAEKFFNDHFRVMTSMKSYSWEEMFFWAEVIHDSDFMYDCIIIEPYNALYSPGKASMHERTIETMNKLQTFKKNFTSVWVADHANSTAARNKDDDDFVKPPWKADLDGGQIKANKVDDLIMNHRIVNSRENYRDMQFHVNKIKDTETGGKHTMKDSPVILTSNVEEHNYLCGFHDPASGFDPVEDYWKRNMIGTQGDMSSNMGKLTPLNEVDNDFFKKGEDAPF